jgi:hypothetical protein
VAVGCNEVCENGGAFYVSGSNDNWPMGFGALVNQQTTHRGPAHTGKNQPERVLFILTFAPRPRYGYHQVETRMLGSGGSYSLHWSQWGHTLQDFADPERRMSYVWRHLKSLGIYKPWGHDWGWDYTTVASQRMVGDELGFNGDDVKDQVQNKGKFNWIPTFLHGSIKSLQHESADIWTTFLIETVENVQAFARQWYRNLLVTYLVVFLAGNALLHEMGIVSNSHMRAIQCVRRVAMLHGGLALFTLLYYRSISRGSWARNIRQGLHLQGPDYNFAPVLPATLPNEQDVLIFDDLQAPFLASTAYVYDYTHPGNSVWKGMTRSYARGFGSLPANVKTDLCSDLVQWQKVEHSSRILIKNSINEWSVAPDKITNRICHKQLWSIDNHQKAYAVQWIDFLIAELRYGYWRETIMNRKHMYPWLVQLQDKILAFEWTPSGHKTTDVLWQAPSKHSFVQVFHLSTIANTRMVALRQKIMSSISSTGMQSRSSLPPALNAQEPYEAAWLQEGNIVEANYNSYTGGTCYVLPVLTFGFYAYLQSVSHCQSIFFCFSILLLTE